MGRGLRAGTVFKITPSGTLTTLHSFDGSDGVRPFAALVQATDGNFYGTTVLGGNDNCHLGYGTIFKITPTGTLTTLHSFDGPEGRYPSATLIQTRDGNLYGTTGNGGANLDGTVFKITPSGTLTTLHSFDGSDGAWPYGGWCKPPTGTSMVQPTGAEPTGMMAQSSAWAWLARAQTAFHDLELRFVVAERGSRLQAWESSPSPEANVTGVTSPSRR